MPEEQKNLLKMTHPIFGNEILEGWNEDGAVSVEYMKTNMQAQFVENSKVSITNLSKLPGSQALLKPFFELVNKDDISLIMSCLAIIGCKFDSTTGVYDENTTKLVFLRNINVRGTPERAYSVMLTAVNKSVENDDPYGFRLLLMGKCITQIIGSLSGNDVTQVWDIYEDVLMQDPCAFRLLLMDKTIVPFQWNYKSLGDKDNSKDVNNFTRDMVQGIHIETTSNICSYTIANRYAQWSILNFIAAGVTAFHVCNQLLLHDSNYKFVVIDKLKHCSSLKILEISRDRSNVRSYLYFEDVIEVFAVILRRGGVGHVYSVDTKKEGRVIDLAKDICRLFNLDHENYIKFVENPSFNDKRYFFHDQKLNSLEWCERITWEEGLSKIKEWYVSNSDGWDDVPGALLPHLRMLMMQEIERQFNVADTSNLNLVHLTNKFSQSKMLVPSTKPNLSDHKPFFMFFIYGRTWWISGLLGKLCEKQSIPFEHGRGRLEQLSQFLVDIQTVKPTHFSNVTGVIGRLKVSWFETHNLETIGTIVETGVGFKKEDKPNFIGLVFSKIKSMVKDIPNEFDSVSTLIVQISISSEFSNVRNFITKITRYSQMVDIPNSMTILDELISVSIEMANRNLEDKVLF